MLLRTIFITNLLISYMFFYVQCIKIPCARKSVLEIKISIHFAHEVHAKRMLKLFEILLVPCEITNYFSYL